MRELFVGLGIRLYARQSRREFDMIPAQPELIWFEGIRDSAAEAQTQKDYDIFKFEKLRATYLCSAPRQTLPLDEDLAVKSQLSQTPGFF